MRRPGRLANLSAAAYFGIAASPRFRATRRRRIRDAARQGMLLICGMALLNCVWLGALHAGASLFILTLNGLVAAAATLGYVGLGSVASRRAEVVVFIELVIVDLATIALAVGYPPLGLVAAGFVLVLPIVVALLIPWATRMHVAYLVMHVAVVVCYAVLAPAPDRPGARVELLGLLAVAVLVSQVGHVSGLRHQVTTFTQLEQIMALNRQARRDRAGLDSLNLALAESAATDALTGLGNRLALDTGLLLARSRIERQGERIGLMIIDLDRFKAINDERGHLAGDGVLRAVARAMREVLRPGDSVYRYGGEEFVVLMRVTHSTEAHAAAERLRLGVEGLQITSPGNKPYGVLTVSVGVTTIGPDDLASDDAAWLAPADAALYRAKTEGRNRSVTAQRPSPPARVSPPASARSTADRRRERVPDVPAAVRP